MTETPVTKILLQEYIKLHKIDFALDHETMCASLWTDTWIYFDQNTIKSCCHTPSKKITEQEIKFYKTNIFQNHPYMLERRQEKLDNKRHGDCDKCWKEEDKGIQSSRLPRPFYEFHKQRFNQHEDNVDALPAQLQILFNNTCDLKCVYCNSDYSSQWAVENKKYLSKEIIKVTANTEFQNTFWGWLTNVSGDKILRYYILGGEPLIQPEFYDFLDKLIPLIKNKPNVFGIKPELIISTNGNTPAKYLNKWFERLEKIQEVITVQMTISIEGTKEQAEYIRSNLNWKLFEQNANSLFASAKKYNTKIRFAISQSALSITSTLELIKWIKQLKDLYKIEIDLIKQVITFPPHLSPCILDKTFDKYVNETCEWIRYNAPEWQDYIKFLQGISDNFNNCGADDRVNFLEFTTTMRERRNLDFLETFPEMLIWYNSLHKYHTPSRIL